MRENRDKLRLGIPVKPPVQQEKIEDLMGKLIPKEVEQTLEKLQDKPRGLPSNYTIQQLLKSFTGYNSWMAQAGKGSSAMELSSQLQDIDDAADDASAKRASLLFQRGLRYMYDTKYQLATEDFEAAYSLTEKNDNIQESMGDQYHRLLAWVGMSRHLRYDLKGASACYEKCSDLEPENVSFAVSIEVLGFVAGCIFKLFSRPLLFCQ
jgi:tetratricopeptide (TPR) repeat protein